MTDFRVSDTAGADGGLRVVQRVVFPGDDLDVIPLYVETNPERGAAELAAELATEALTGFKPGNVPRLPPARSVTHSRSSASVPTSPPTRSRTPGPAAAP